MSPWNDTADASAYGSGLLRGERVRLRRLRDDDLPTLDAWWADPTWVPLQQLTVKPRPEGAAAEMFRNWSANTLPGDVGFCLSPLDSDELLGHATLFGASLPLRAATLAILLGPEHQGQGHGTDAVRLLVRYGFAELGLNRIELRVWAYNTRARRAYAKAGFTDEGTRRDAAFHDGEFHDEVIMSILRREWDAQR